MKKFESVYVFVPVLSLLLAATTSFGEGQSGSGPYEPALSLKIEQGKCHITIDGKITRDLANALAEAERMYGCREPLVTLSSNGGDVDAAMQIGHTLRRMLATVMVPVSTYYHPDSFCASSCILALVGGTSRHVADWETGKALGVHSFYDLSGTYSPEQAYDGYSDTYRKVRQYLIDMRVSERLLDLCYSAAPWETRWLTEDEAKDLLVVGHDPVTRDYLASLEAAEIGISFEVFIQRKATIPALCGADDSFATKGEGFARIQCEKDVLAGRIR